MERGSNSSQGSAPMCLVLQRFVCHASCICHVTGPELSNYRRAKQKGKGTKLSHEAVEAGPLIAPLLLLKGMSYLCETAFNRKTYIFKEGLFLRWSWLSFQSISRPHKKPLKWGMWS